MRRVDRRRALRRVARRDQPIHGNRCVIRIRQIRRAVREHSPHHFHCHVHAVHVIPIFQRHVLEHVQRFDNRHAARTRRRRRQHFPCVFLILIFRPQRLAHLRLIRREIFQRDDPAKRVHIRRDGPCRFSAVKLFGTIFGNAPQRGGKFRLLKYIARLPQPAIAQKYTVAGRKLLQVGSILLQLMRQLGAHREAILRQANCRRHYICQLHRAVRFQRQRQSRHRPRHGHGARPHSGRTRIQLPIPLDVHIARGVPRRHLTIIKEAAAPIGQPHQHEPAAPDISRRWFYHRQRERHGHRGVHGISAALHNLDAGLRSKFLVARDHAMRCTHRLLRPRRRGGRFRAVAVFGGDLRLHMRRTSQTGADCQGHQRRAP